MNQNTALLEQFYSAFQQRDYKTMQTCYADNAVFNDPAFVNLDAMHVRNMWEMLCVGGKDLQLTYSNITANETKGSAEWIATYTFSATGRKVINHIKSDFTFQDGKIIRQTDTFNFHKWSRQALGFVGASLGWTTFLKNKVREKAAKSLETYIKNKK